MPNRGCNVKCHKSYEQIKNTHNHTPKQGMRCMLFSLTHLDKHHQHRYYRGLGDKRSLEHGEPKREEKKLFVPPETNWKRSVIKWWLETVDLPFPHQHTVGDGELKSSTVKITHTPCPRFGSFPKVLLCPPNPFRNRSAVSLSVPAMLISDRATGMEGRIQCEG